MSALGSRQAGIAGSVATTGQLLPMGYLLQEPARQQGADGRLPRYVVQGGELIGQIRIGVFNSARWLLASDGFRAHGQLSGRGAGCFA